MLRFLIIIAALVASSFGLNNDSVIIEEKSLSNDDISLIDQNSSRIQTRSNQLLNVFKNSDVQSHLKNTNPNLLRYFSNKEGNVFNDIMRQISNNNNATNNDNEQVAEPSKDPQYEVNTEFNDDNNFHDLKMDRDSMYAHETQTTDHKDPITKMITQELIDSKNPTISAQYVPDTHQNFHDYLHCCEHLFHSGKYGGGKNYVHEDVYVIPQRIEEYPANHHYHHHHQYPVSVQPTTPIMTGHQVLTKPSPRYGQAYSSIPDPEPRVPLIVTTKEIPSSLALKHKLTDAECIEYFHNIHSAAVPINGNIIAAHRIEIPGSSSRLHRQMIPVQLSENVPFPSSMGGKPIQLGEGGHLIQITPANIDTNLPHSPSAQGIAGSWNEPTILTTRRSGFSIPFGFPMPTPSQPPPPPPSLLARKLSYLSRKYLG